MVKAWLDDYKLITVTPVSECRSQAFSMRLNNEEIELVPDYIGNDTLQLHLPKSLKLENTYYLNIGEESVLIEYRFVVKTEKFNNFFYYSGKLGSFYTKESTAFYLWAPTASEVTLLLEKKHVRMSRMEKGVYFVRVAGDYDGATYLYDIVVNGKKERIIDPYSDSVTPNAKKSVVINPAKLRKLTPFVQKEDPIIYECSVRDFTMDPNTNIVNKGKYLGFVEEEKTNRNTTCGIAYLRELGITYVQIMPVTMIGTLDATKPEKTYNWGYDPVLYTCPEGSYASDPEDPYKRITELQEMVEKLHASKLGVVFDVVFNHIYHGHNVFEKVVPYYYFRYDEKNKLYNGSGCGNDLDTQQSMARHYIRKGIEIFMKRYGADGFRFDLMGMIDNETMKDVCELARSIHPDVILYGEGWNMPTGLKDEEKTSMENQATNGKIGYFNDWFRNTLRGYSISDRGYLNGNPEIGKAVINAYVGSVFQYLPGYLFDDPNKSVNYLECHDDATVYDRLGSYSEEEKKSICKAMMASVMLSQGVPFIHSGQEFMRTKYGVHNSYNSGDTVNMMDYLRKDVNQDMVAYFEYLVKLRKRLGFFHLNYRQIVEHYSFRLTDDHTLKIYINTFGISPEFHSIRIIINPRGVSWTEVLDDEYILLLDEQGEREKRVDEIDIQPYSVYVYGKRNMEI